MRYRRAFYLGATYFFTFNLLDRSSSLLINEVDKLRIAFQQVRLLHPFEIDGIVILPDHVHMLITLPEGDSNYSLRIRLIKRLFSKQIKSKELISSSRLSKGERGIWQRRFWEHVVRDEKDFENHLNYILYNPVKHGYVTKAADWRFSSIHRSIRKGEISRSWGSGDDEYFQDIGDYGEYIVGL